MSDAARNLAPVIERPRSDALAELLPQVRPAEHNDNETTAELPGGERRGFEVPGRLWVTMVGCYAVFIIAMMIGLGGGESTFYIIVSGLYFAMFFGLVATLVRHGPKQGRSPVDGASRTMETLYGPLKAGEVTAQMLVVPLCVAFFGIAILIIRLSVG